MKTLTAKDEEMPVTLDGISGSRVEMVAAVVQAIASGTLDTVRGGRLIAVLGPEEIQEKLEKLESMMIAEQNDEQQEKTCCLRSSARRRIDARGSDTPPRRDFEAVPTRAAIAADRAR